MLREVGRRRSGIAPQGLRLGVGLDKRDLFRAAAGEAEVVERHPVDREVDAGGAIFRRHVGDRRPVGERQRLERRAVELDELAHDAVAAQPLDDGEHEIRRGRALGQFAGQLHADHRRHQQRQRLAQHGGLRLDPADAPADDAQAVDHRRVAVDADQRVGEGHGAVLVLRRLHHGREVFQVHLVDDAGARRDDAEILERRLAPAEEFVALLVAAVFDIDVLERGAGLAESLDGQRVVDDQVDRDQRVDRGRITAGRRDRVAHRGKVGHAGAGQQVLHQHPAGTEGDLLRPPGDQRADAVLGDADAVEMAQQVLQQHLDGIGQAGEVADPGRRRRGQAVVAVIRAADGKRASDVEGVGAGHAVSPGGGVGRSDRILTGPLSISKIN